MTKKRALITQNHLCDLAGSEIVTLEIAQYLKSIGYNVEVFTRLFNEPIKKYFDQANIPVFDTDRGFSLNEYDIVWVHHQLLPESILRQLPLGPKVMPRFIYHHMSPYEPLEFPFLLQLELSLADTILCNSEETRNSFIERNLPEYRMAILGNPAPDQFHYNGPAKKTKLSSILVVSNHVTPEVKEAAEIFKRSNIDVTFVGHEAAPLLVTKNLLRKHDLVITIGKTFQYCLLANVPVYCYDHFGGPGYIVNYGQFKVAREYNFSGRGFSKKLSAIELHTDISDQFEKARKYWSYLHSKYSTDFTLSNRLAPLLKTRNPAGVPDSVRALTNDYIESAIAVLDITRRDLITRHSLDTYKNAHDKIYQDLRQSQLAIQDLVDEINETRTLLEQRTETLNRNNTTIDQMEKRLADNAQVIDQMEKRLADNAQVIERANKLLSLGLVRAALKIHRLKKWHHDNG